MPPMTRKQRAYFKANWKSILPHELVLDILIAQGYTRRAALREVSLIKR